MAFRIDKARLESSDYLRRPGVRLAPREFGGKMTQDGCEKGAGMNPRPSNFVAEAEGQATWASMPSCGSRST
jgi:hypothetical protein